MITLSSNTRILLCSSAILLGTRIGGSSQNVKPERVERSSYLLGETTVQELASAITMRSGTPISVDPAIQQRRVTAFLSHVSPREALVAVADLYEWVVGERPSGGFTLRRTKPSVPRTLSDFPKAIHAVIPPDMKRYIGVGVKLEDLPRAADRVEARLNRVIKQSGPHYRREVWAERIPIRINGGMRGALLSLFDSLKSNLLQGKSVAYNELDSYQREDLAAVVFVKKLSELLIMPGVLYDDLEPYLVDWNRLELSVKGNDLTFGATDTRNGVTSFIGGAVSLKDP